jgi:general stress protein YciG
MENMNQNMDQMEQNMTQSSSVEMDKEQNEELSSPKKKLGFACISKARRTEISSKGGRAAHALGRAYKFDSEKAREAGKIGGRAPHVSRGRPRPVKIENNQAILDLETKA